MHVDVSRPYFHAKAQRPVLVKLPAEDCSGNDKGEFGLLKQSMYSSKQLGTRLARGPRKLGYELGRSFRNLFLDKKGIFRG